MATTEKMLPGIMPGKDELEKYISLYADPDFSLEDRIEHFDSSTLPKAYIETFCRRYPAYTLVGLSEEEEKALAEKPVLMRRDTMAVGHKMNLENFQSKESRFREEKNEKAYKALRSAFSTAIGSKVCFDYLDRQCDQYTREEHARQIAEYEIAREKSWKEWKEKEACRKRLRAILESDPYLEGDYDDLSDEEYEELEEMQGAMFADWYSPFGYTREYSPREWEMVDIPVPSVKFRTIRKALKLNQRDFAKRIGYNINKYQLLEQGKLEKLGYETIYEAFPDTLIKAVVDATYANPYWLEDWREESVDSADQEKTAKTVQEAEGIWDIPMFADAKVIRHWWSRHR